MFEDNAEFGLGFRLTVDQHRERVRRLLASLGDAVPAGLQQGLQDTSLPVSEQRAHIEQLRALLQGHTDAAAQELARDADYLVEKSVWLIGGDGWAYDIGYGGLDHVLSLGENINVLVLDTQCYSNTGGQQSKATPLGAITKFGEQGKRKHAQETTLPGLPFLLAMRKQVNPDHTGSNLRMARPQAISSDGASSWICLPRNLPVAMLKKGLARMVLGIWVRLETTSSRP